MSPFDLFGSRPAEKVVLDRSYWDSLFKQEDYSDITIKLSDRQLTCHKAVICNRSEYFKKLCGKDCRFSEGSQRVVELKDDNPDAVEAVLVHLYFGPYVASDDEVKSNDWRFHAEVARVADKYLVEELRSKAMTKCSELLAAVVEMSQLCDNILEIKSKFSDIDELMKKATTWQEERINTLLQEPRFVDSLTEAEIREQFDRLRGVIGGMIEKQGHLCNGCGRMYVTANCKIRGCGGSTKVTKYWIPNGE